MSLFRASPEQVRGERVTLATEIELALTPAA
jgi:hypothetical protein